MEEAKESIFVVHIAEGDLERAMILFKDFCI